MLQPRNNRPHHKHPAQLPLLPELSACIHNLIPCLGNAQRGLFEVGVGAGTAGADVGDDAVDASLFEVSSYCQAGLAFT